MYNDVARFWKAALCKDDEDFIHPMKVERAPSDPMPNDYFGRIERRVQRKVRTAQATSNILYSRSLDGPNACPGYL